MVDHRPIFADRLALSIINLGRCKGKVFKKHESGAVIMSDESRKTFACGVSG
jgi:CRISPR-associated protein Cas1